MDPGELKHRIAIYKNEITENSLNEEQPKTTLLKRIWAKVEPRTGSLITGRPADTMLSKTTHAIKVRAGAAKGITEDCYVLWKDKNEVEHHFDINYILPPCNEPLTTIYVQEVI